MANNLTSNTTDKIARVFLEEFQKQRVLTKTVNTQLLTGMFNPASGERVRFKRPHQYNSVETTGGDISAVTKNDIISGTAEGRVQDYITVPLTWTNREEVLELDQLAEILRPAAEELATRFETNMCDFMIKNSGLTVGLPGTPVDAWKDVVGANSLMSGIGVPMSGKKYYVMNPFTQASLAEAQSGLTAADQLVRTAWENAQISTPFAGLRGLSSNSMSTYTAGATADRDGVLGATPDGTYVTAKDSMVQTLILGGLTISTVGAVKPGDVIEFTGTGALARSQIHRKTRKTVFDELGAPVKWRCTVLTGGDTDGSGDVTVTVASAAINETDGQYNNVSVALTSGDLFTILGTENVEYQPNLFYHEDAFGVATVALDKLAATDTTATTSDGISIRVTKYSDGDKNIQKIRFDLLPAFAAFNQSFAGKGFGK